VSPAHTEVTWRCPSGSHSLIRDATGGSTSYADGNLAQVRSAGPGKWGFEWPAWLRVVFFRRLNRARVTLSRRVGEEESIASTRRSLARAERVHGRDSPITVSGLEMLGEQLRDADQLEESIALLQEVVARRTEALGPDDVQTAIAARNLALSLAKSNRHEEAVVMFKRVIDVTSHVSGYEEKVLKTMAWLGTSLTTLKRYEEAQDFLERAVDGLRHILGPEDEWTVNASARLAFAQARDKRYERAIEVQRSVVEACARRHGPDDPRTLSVRLQLAAFLQWSGSAAEARMFAHSVLDAKTRFGVDDDTTEKTKELLAVIDGTPTEG
jgi:tetratricopeptide (TPR) repeat protein